MPPSDIDLQDLRRALRKLDATCEPTRHGHYKARRDRLVYTFPTVHGRKVKAIYIPKLRRKLHLDAEHGVSDDEFWKA